MINKISDVFKDVKDRLSSPLFFSFLLSWIITNWRITVALLWYDPAQIENEKYRSVFDFIQKNTYSYTSFWFWWPLVFAILFTGINPVVRNFVSWFNTFMNKKGEAWRQNTTMDSNVPMTKFLAQKAEYDKRTKILEKIIKDESKTIEDFQKEHTGKLAAEQKNIELSNTIATLKQFNEDIGKEKDRVVSLLDLAQEAIVLREEDLNSLKEQTENSRKLVDDLYNVKTIAGTWNLTTSNGGDTRKELITIEGYDYFLRTGNKTEQLYKIKHFYYDSLQQTIFFIKDPMVFAPTARRDKANDNSSQTKDTGPRKIICELQLKEPNIMVGMENTISLVTYKRVTEGEEILSAPGLPSG